MKKYKLIIKTLSPTLIGSGFGSTLIDTDTEFHSSGFPIIRARTIKGLLRESAMEINEIIETEQSINDIFGEGNRDYTEHKLRIGNAYIQGWDGIKDVIHKLNRESEKIKEFYSQVIQQTSIDEKSEIAKDSSLRSYRLLKPDLIFESTIEVEDTFKPFLDNACLNLRYAGTRRNRGWGKISVSIKEITKEIESTILKPIIDINEIEDLNIISVKVTTVDPVVLGTQIGDQNTVNSQVDISGNHVRGIIIQEYLKNGGNSDNKDFFDIFFSGNVRFGNLRLNNSEALPLHYHYEKTDQEKKCLNVFTTEDKITKPIGQKFTTIDNSLYLANPKLTSYFHNTRSNDRAAGRSTKDADGGIF